MLIDLTFFVLGLLMMKGVIEPVAAYWGRRLAQRLLPQIFDHVDRIYPMKGIEQVVINQIMRLADEQGINEQEQIKLLAEFRRYYDPIIAEQKRKQS